MNKRHFLAALVSVLVFAAGCTTTGSDSGDPATRRQSLNSGVDNALASLARQVPVNGQLVNNPHQRWNQVNPALPNIAIINSPKIHPISLIFSRISPFRI